MRNKKERLGEVSVEQTEFVCVCCARTCMVMLDDEWILDAVQNKS